MSVSKQQARAIAHASYRTFTRVLDDFRVDRIPAKIERSMWTKMSGSSQHMMYATLLGLGLIDSAGLQRPALRSLVDARGTDGWKDALRKLLADVYADVEATVSLENGTLSQLREALKAKSGLKDGDTLSRAVRFYLAALKDAGVKYSAYFKVRTPRKPRKSTPNPKPTPAAGGEGGDERRKEIPAQAEGTETFPIPGKGSVVFPEDITEADCDYLDAMFRAYAKRRAVEE